VRIVAADDRGALELAMVENLQRENLNPIEEARGFRALMEEFDMTQEEVAKRVSKSRPAVANALRLLSLPPELMEFVLRAKLSAGSARALLALKDVETMRGAAQMAVDRNMSVREVEAVIKKLSAEKKKRAKPPDSDEDYLIDAQNRLTSTMGRRVTIRHAKGKGRIEIEFYSQDDFDALFDELTSIEVGIKKEVRDDA